MALEEYSAEGQSHISQFFHGLKCIFSGRNFHFGTPQTNFSGFKSEKKKKKKTKNKTNKQTNKTKQSFYPHFHFHTFDPSVLSFQVFPLPFHDLPSFPLHFFLVFLAPLFPFLLCFPLPSLFPSFRLPSKIFPQNFPRLGDSPTSPTLLTPLF